ncbi:MAG: hypothetical protein OXG38_00090 [Chloroflexi bacterium]|nr:hypothetical protein [Chloroflexota bacterium]
MRFVRELRRRWRGNDAAPPPRSDYLWNPADPRSFQALRESGGAVAAGPRPRAQRAVARDDGASERLDPLELVPGAGIRRVLRRRVVVAVAGTCGVVAAALTVVSVVAPEGAPAGDGAPAAETDPDTASPDETTAAAPADGTTAPPAVAAAEAEAQYLQAVRDVSWKVRGQLESIFEEGLRYTGRGSWHWARRDDRVFARPLAHSGVALGYGLEALAAITPPDRFAADHSVLRDYYTAAIDRSRIGPRTGEGRDRHAFLLTGVDLQRLERISAARLSEAACTAFVGPLPFCWQPATIPGGAYGASVNAAIRELAAPRLPGDGPPPLMHTTPEEDRALAEARLEARSADLRRARTTLRVLQPPREFRAEHAALLETLALLAGRMEIEQNQHGAHIVATEWAAREGICLVERTFSPAFRTIAPLQLLAPERPCRR